MEFVCLVNFAGLALTCIQPSRRSSDTQGQIPWDISKLNMLQRLAFTSNQMTGPIPNSICNVPFLRGLFLGYNDFSGNIPPCIGDLSKMQLLFVSAMQRMI